MSNSTKSVISGIIGIILILTAVRDMISPLDSVLLIVGVILLALGATVADRDRRLSKEYNKRKLMQELRISIEHKDESEQEKEPAD